MKSIEEITEKNERIVKEAGKLYKDYPWLSIRESLEIAILIYKNSPPSGN